MEELLIYYFFRLPGALVLWLISGFKYNLGNVVKEKGENTKEWVISILFYVIVVGTLIIVNN